MTKTKKVILKVWKCKRLSCGWEWEGRIAPPPRACPSCKSYKWNEEHKHTAVAEPLKEKS